MRKLLLSTLLLAASCIAVGSPLASAKVHVDPNGPAGQQYALPLDSARGEAAGDGSVGTPGSSAKAPLFGKGIKPPSGGAGAAAKNGHAATGQQGSNTADAQGIVDAAQTSSSSDDGGSSTILWVIGLIAAVLLIGAGGGLVARRRVAAEPHG